MGRPHETEGRGPATYLPAARRPGCSAAPIRVEVCIFSSGGTVRRAHGRLDVELTPSEAETFSGETCSGCSPATTNVPSGTDRGLRHTATGDARGRRDQYDARRRRDHRHEEHRVGWFRHRRLPVGGSAPAHRLDVGHALAAGPWLRDNDDEHDEHDGLRRAHRLDRLAEDPQEVQQVVNEIGSVCGDSRNTTSRAASSSTGTRRRLGGARHDDAELPHPGPRDPEGADRPGRVSFRPTSRPGACLPRSIPPGRSACRRRSLTRTSRPNRRWCTFLKALRQPPLEFGRQTPARPSGTDRRRCAVLRRRGRGCVVTGSGRRVERADRRYSIVPAGWAHPKRFPWP